MGHKETLYLFGDQTFDIEPHLPKLLQAKHSNVILRDFLDKAYDAIRVQIFELPRQEREGLPRFTGIEDVLLLKRSGWGYRCVPLDMALTCIYQLGSFIINQTEETSCPIDEKACTLGLCTGAIAAVTVSCSHGNLTELVTKGLEAIIVAFRVGLCVTNMRLRLSSFPSTTSFCDESWSMMVAGPAAQEAVRNFYEESALPATGRPFISAYTPSSLAVSGPPGSLSKLATSPHFRRLKYKSKAVYAPYHAPHLYSETDIDDILAPLALDDNDQTHSTKVIPVISGTGKYIEGGPSFKNLLRGALEDILLQPIRWNGILDELRVCFGQPWDPIKCKVELFGSRADQLIYAALGGQSTGLRPAVSASYHGNKSSRSSLNSISGSVDTGTRATTQARPKIAIIGMSGRFPGGANSSEAFWDLLREGLDVHEEVPPLHWSKAHVDVTGTQKKNTSATPYGCWLSDPAAFDARFFNISPREAPQIDPAQRIALMTTYEALEQAGIVPDATPSTRRDRVGVFYGVTSNDWMETNSAQNIDTYFIPGGNRAFIPGRINYFFKFSGPSYAVDTACSSSLAAIHQAINSLWQRDIDMAIAGGTNVLTNPDFTSGLDRGHFLSRTGNCKTFDDSADGYCRGEGVGTVILKRMDDAIADKDPILGVILGAYTNHSAEADSITRPHTGAQRAIFSKILNASSVDANSVGYVEMHGTGTQAGDATEMASVLEVFAPRGQAPRTEPVYLGAAKPNVGHGEAVSGVSSLIKVLLMMKNRLIPPHVGIKTKINHKFPTDLHERNVHIAKTVVPWCSTEGSKPRRAFVNNFSAAGGNTAILLEEAPATVFEGGASSDVDVVGANLVAVSAKTGPSLQSYLWSLKGFLLKESLKTATETMSVGQLSYTTTARRMHHPHRAMLIGSSVDELLAQIDIVLREQTGMVRPKAKNPKIIFAFTGQGAQFPGMGRQLMATFALFRSELRQLDQISRGLGFPSIMPVYMAGEHQSLDDFPPVQVQLASVCMQIALAHLWASWGIVPQAVVGHSLGEYAALNVAGVLSDLDTIYLVGTRAQLLQDLCTRGTHAMLVARASAATISATLDKTPHQIACMNSPIETVMAGPDHEISTASRILDGGGIKTTRLKVPYAFHSTQVDPILAPFEEAASSVRYLTPKCPVLCPLDGTIVSTDGTFGPGYLGRHCRQPVNLAEALTSARRAGIMPEQSILLEIGPHPAVSGMVKATLGPQTTVISALNRKPGTKDVLADALRVVYQAGADIAWAKYHGDFKASQKVITGLPAYNWDLKPYWIQYVNDWSLRKGDAHPVLSSDEAGGDKAKLTSTTIHRVVEDSSSENGTKEHIVVEANIARPDLQPLVQGHMVDDIPLCTPSVYADMALTLGRYLVKRRQNSGLLINAGQQTNQVDVSDMTIFKALIARPQGPQPLQGHCEVDWSKNEASMNFVSFDNKGKTQEHAKCTLRFTDRSLLLNKLRKEATSTKARMGSLRRGISEETAARFNRPMVYRMIRPLAQFHDDYRAIEEVVLNSNTLEASASVSFGGIKKGGDFALHPAIIDAFTQSCGFAMNCNDHTDLDKEVFMNHGWGGFQVFEEVHLDRPYTSFTQMFEGKDKLWHGDVVIFDGDTIVASFEKIAIQCVPRRVLRVILSLESGGKSKKSVAAPPGSQPHLSPVKETRASFATNVAENHVKIAVPPGTDTQGPPGASSTKVTTAMQIVSEESGVAIGDLTNDSAFADLGVDSLLGLTISARFREELDLELDFDAMFVSYPTIGDLKALVDPGTALVAAEVVKDRRENSTSVVLVHSTASAVVEVEAVEREAGSIPSSTVQNARPEFDFNPALKIVSEESGIAMEELTDDTNFADTGVDSLLSLVIVSRFREELDLDISMDSLFVDCATVADLKSHLSGASLLSSDSDSSSQGARGSMAKTIDFSEGATRLSKSAALGTVIEVRPLSATPTGSSSEETEVSSTMDTSESEASEYRSIVVPRTTSLVLQGNPKTARKTLFLFPDGSGSASSYAAIPPLATDTCVVALNSPFLKQPEQLRAARLDDVIIDGYLAEIQRRQPHGPYHFGGWSAGGILAYRAAQIMTNGSGCESDRYLQREQVLSLSLIDSPSPLKGLDRLPPHFYEYCESLHLFGHKSSSSASAAGRGAFPTPSWLIPHFNATIDLLHEYRAAPMRPGRFGEGALPKTNIIWAAASIADNPRLPKLAPHPDDTEGMKFLLERRSDFGGNGWERLFPGLREEDLRIERVEGAHHFSMMREPYSKQLAEFLARAMT